MKRYIVMISVIAAALIGPALVAVPASAGNTTNTAVQCSTGDSCTAMLEHMIQVSGDTIPFGMRLNTVIDIAPPPCLWNPIGETVPGSQQIISQNPNPTSFLGVKQSVQQAKSLLKDKPPPAGEWYTLPINPAASPAGQAECWKLPLYAWAPPDQTPPGINIPPRTLAQLAIARVALPAAGTLVFSPANGHTFTNLPTFVRVTLATNQNGTNKNSTYETGVNGQPYVTVTAKLNGTSVTVWAEASRLQLSASGGSSYTPDTSNCGYLGSQEMVSNPKVVANTGVGGYIDCGLTFQTPATWQVTASMAWQTCWAQAPAGTPPPDPATCTPVPGAQLTGTNWLPQPVTVNEIQSINNGNG